MLMKESQSRQEKNKTHAEKRKREERNTGVIFQVISGGGGENCAKNKTSMLIAFFFQCYVQLFPTYSWETHVRRDPGEKCNL